MNTSTVRWKCVDFTISLFSVEVEKKTRVGGKKDHPHKNTFLRKPSPNPSGQFDGYSERLCVCAAK
jgi:hypothetical protein